MNRKRFASFAVAAVLVLVPAVAFAAVTGWSDAHGGTNPWGQATTLDSRPYLTAIVQTYIDGGIGASQYRELIPTTLGFLVAQATNGNPGPGTHQIVVNGWHEAAELPNGADKEISTSSDSVTFTISGLASNVTQTVQPVDLAKAHTQVSTVCSIDSAEYDYYSFKDFKAISDGEVIRNRDLALAFLVAAREIERTYLNVGDAGPGYWFSKDRSEVIVGSEKADGSIVAFSIKLIDDKSDANGLTWSEPVPVAIGR